MTPRSDPSEPAPPTEGHPAPAEIPKAEAWIGVPVAVLLLLVIAGFTIASYRNAIDLLVRERRDEAAELAETLARRTDPGRLPAPADLADSVPQARRVLIVRRNGRVLVAAGQPLLGDPLFLLDDPVDAGVSVRGPDPDTLDLVVVTPIASDLYLRIDLPAPVLARQLRTVSILTWVVLGTALAVGLWTVAFVRRLLSPWEALLARVRELGPRDAGDDAAFLLATVERALGEIGRESDSTEIELLEDTLGTSLESGLLLLDDGGRILVLNPPGADILGLRAPPPRTSVDEALADRTPLLDLLLPAIERREGLQRAECEITVAGEPRSLGLNVTTLRRSRGDVLGYLVLFSDLTDDRQQDRATRLAESLARLGEIAAGLAHELRNSLATLRGYLGLLDSTEDPSARDDYLGEIDDETRRLERVVSDFLAFARPGTARIEAVDLGALVTRAAADPALSPLDVRLAECESGCIVQGDPELIGRAVRNLLLNAGDATLASGRGLPVEISCRRIEGSVEIAIADRGPGIPAGLRDELFEPFASGRSDGVGLGLALTIRIVTLHDGTISLEDREGGGTVARLLLPAADSEEGDQPSRGRPENEGTDREE